jgi:hypothetical protein
MKQRKWSWVLNVLRRNVRFNNVNTKFRQFIYVTFKMSVDFLHSTSASQRKTG